jgi:LPXTG-motif cell wall-anchored protein
MLQAAPQKVGVKMRGVPYLGKELEDEQGNAFLAEQDETFTFLVYQGTNQNLDNTLTADEMMDQLSVAGITNFSLVTRTVPEGEEHSEMLAMEGLKKYVYDESSKSWVAGKDTMTWTEGKRYNIVEVTSASNPDYFYYSVDDTKQTTYSFIYNASITPKLDVVNRRDSWQITLTKYDELYDDPLEGAVFAIYTTNSELSIEDQAEDYEPEILDTSFPRNLNMESQNWYLMRFGTTDEFGRLTWDLLMEDRYYVLEIQAPDGYTIGDENGWFVSRSDIVSDDEATLTIRNMRNFVIPLTGGMGTTAFTLAGATLIVAAGGAATITWRRRRQSVQLPRNGKRQIKRGR